MVLTLNNNLTYRLDKLLKIFLLSAFHNLQPSLIAFTLQRRVSQAYLFSLLQGDCWLR